MQLICLLFIFLHYSSAKAPISVCKDVEKAWNDPKPEGVLIRDYVNSSVSKQYFDDFECYLRKIFNFHNKYTPSVDILDACFYIANAKIKPFQSIVVLTNRDVMNHCFVSFHGSLPNMFLFSLYVHVTNPSRQVKAALITEFRNAGGRLSMEFDLQRNKTKTKLVKALAHFKTINDLTLQYGALEPYWKPTVKFPVEYELSENEPEKKHVNIFNRFIFTFLTTLPMMLFSIVVSCYLVVQPYDGLTYTDEDIEFIVEEVESATETALPNHTAAALISVAEEKNEKKSEVEHSKRTTIEVVSERKSVRIESIKKENLLPEGTQKSGSGKTIQISTAHGASSYL